MKPFTSPMVLTGPMLASATLRYTGASGIPRTIALTVVNNLVTSGTTLAGTSTLTLPTGVSAPNGVMELNVVPCDSECCCRTMMVYSESCTPVVLPNKHTGDAGAGALIPSCDP